MDRLAQELQDLLRRLVGDLQDRDAGLRQDLRLCQLRRGRGEVGVVDLAAGVGNILQGDTQRIEVRLNDVFLQGTESGTDRVHFGQGLVDDVDQVGSRDAVLTDVEQALAVARTQLVDLARRTAERGRVRGVDPHADLPGDR